MGMTPMFRYVCDRCGDTEARSISSAPPLKWSTIEAEIKPPLGSAALRNVTWVLCDVCADGLIDYMRGDPPPDGDR